jgi:hypothetical protein
LVSRHSKTDQRACSMFCRVSQASRHTESRRG